MPRNMYNYRLFSQAFKILSSNPFKANILLKEYINIDPRSCWAYHHYITSLITIGKFEEAEKELKELIYKKDVEKKHIKQVEKLENNIIKNKLRILSYMEKYEELYNYYQENFSLIESMDINAIVFYSKNKVNMFDPERRDIKGYTFRQMLEYDENEFREHIRKHTADCNKEAEIPNPCIFSPDFPLDKIIEEIKKYIPSDNRIYPGFYENAYIFKYDECGRNENKITDYFKVICFHNTDQIITMYPDNFDEYMPYVDLNYLKQNNKETVRRLSQTEKFNRRYKR